MTLDGDFSHQGQDTEIAQRSLRFSKNTDMTDHSLESY
jgi:hypothetical protein